MCTDGRFSPSSNLAACSCNSWFLLSFDLVPANLVALGQVRYVTCSASLPRVSSPSRALEGLEAGDLICHQLTRWGALRKVFIPIDAPIEAEVQWQALPPPETRPSLGSIDL
jgi:hypothetical protein